jgi:hypothetical protein
MIMEKPQRLISSFELESGAGIPRKFSERGLGVEMIAAASWIAWK